MSITSVLVSFLVILSCTHIHANGITSSHQAPRHLRIPIHRHHHHHHHHTHPLERIRTSESQSQPSSRHMQIDTSLFEHVRKKKHPPTTPPPTHNTTNTSIHITLTNYYSVMYTGELGIGTPSQYFNMIYDTGSSCLWVLSHRIPTRHHTFLHYYDAMASKTAHPLIEPWSIEYGVGTVSGVLTNDTVRLGSLVAKGQVFAEAIHLSTNFVNENQPMDGILGLAFRGGACSRFPTFLDNLYQQGQIDHRIFSFYLTRDTHDAMPDSEMIIGPPDASLYKTSLIYTPVLHSGKPQMWFVLLEGFTIGTDDMITLSLCGFFDNPCVALPDTGTSFLTVPPSQWERVIDAITDGRTDCMVDASKNTFCLDGPSGLPNLVFHFRGHQFVLTSDDYMLPNNQIAIQTLDFGIADMDIIILGDAFLRTIYTVFDADELRVGFANARVLPRQSSPYIIFIMALAGFLCFCFLLDWCRHMGRRSEYESLQ